MGRSVGELLKGDSYAPRFHTSRILNLSEITTKCRELVSTCGEFIGASILELTLSRSTDEKVKAKVRKLQKNINVCNFLGNIYIQTWDGIKICYRGSQKVTDHMKNIMKT